MPRRSGQFFIGVGLILLSLMAGIFAASTRGFRQPLVSSAAHAAVVEAETVRAVRSAFANASNTADIAASFNSALLRAYLGGIVTSEQGVFVDFSIVEPASRGNGTVSAEVLVSFRTEHAHWNLTVPLRLKQEVVSMTVARGTSPQFEVVTFTVLLTLNELPDRISSSSFIVTEGGNANIACTVSARYSDGRVVLQAQVPTGWTGGQLVTVDINGIKVWTSLKHPA
jgi:hypothetical protein